MAGSEWWGAQPKLDATVARRYSLTLVGGALTLQHREPGHAQRHSRSPLFGKRNLLPAALSVATPGNRAIFVQAVFTF